MTPAEFRERVFDYCLAFSGSETSGFRTVEHNAAVGGVLGSPHCSGVGADVIYDGSRPGLEADTWLRERDLKRIPESDHDHLQPLGWRNRAPELP